MVAFLTFWFAWYCGGTTKQLKHAMFCPVCLLCLLNRKNTHISSPSRTPDTPAHQHTSRPSTPIRIVGTWVIRSSSMEFICWKRCTFTGFTLGVQGLSRNMHTKWNMSKNSLQEQLVLQFVSEMMHNSTQVGAYSVTCTRNMYKWLHFRMFCTKQHPFPRRGGSHPNFLQILHFSMFFKKKHPTSSKITF